MFSAKISSTVGPLATNGRSGATPAMSADAATVTFAGLRASRSMGSKWP
jgi:hypothetical protein